MVLQKYIYIFDSLIPINYKTKIFNNLIHSNNLGKLNSIINFKILLLSN